MKNAPSDSPHDLRLCCLESFIGFAFVARCNCFFNFADQPAHARAPHFIDFRATCDFSNGFFCRSCIGHYPDFPVLLTIPPCGSCLARKFSGGLLADGQRLKTTGSQKGCHKDVQFCAAYTWLPANRQRIAGMIIRNRFRVNPGAGNVDSKM